MGFASLRYYYDRLKLSADSNTVVQIPRDSLAPALTVCWHLTKQQHLRRLILRQYGPPAFQVKLDEEGHEERSDWIMINTPGQAPRRFFGVMEWVLSPAFCWADFCITRKSWPYSWQATQGSWAGNKEQLGKILNKWAAWKNPSHI